MGNKHEKHGVVEVYPEDLLVVFSRGRIMIWMAAAIMIHVVVIGVTSVGYIRDTWIDPEGAKVRKEAADAAVAAEKAAARVVKPATSAATNAPAVSGAKADVTPMVGKTNSPAARDDEAATLESRRDTTVVKRVTEAAASNEIPVIPDLGISLEDTNPR